MTQVASQDSSQSERKAEASEVPWQGVCSSGCYAAKTDKKKCKCKCRGEHHGKGQTHEPDEATLTEFCEEQEP